MRHCCEFDAFDIWYLEKTDEFTNRTLYIGDCPRCNKHVVILVQKNIKTNTYLTIKKVGDSAHAFSKKLLPERIYSRNANNRMNMKSCTYGWRYGENKEKIDKNGNKTVNQYAVDFYGNKELIKEKKEQ